MKVLKIKTGRPFCLNEEIEMREFSPHACLTDAYGSEELANKNWDNFAMQRLAGMRTISTILKVGAEDAYYTYVCRS